MEECERCGAVVARLFGRRIRSETMTHRRTRRVCANCHPSLPDSVERDRAASELVADGGIRTGCPVCSGITVVDGKSDACVDCGWTGRR